MNRENNVLSTEKVYALGIILPCVSFSTADIGADFQCFIVAGVDSLLVVKKPCVNQNHTILE